MLLLWLLAVPAALDMVAAEVYVNEEAGDIADMIDSVPSDFGPMMPLRGLSGYLLLGRPLDGCFPLEVLPPNITNADFFVLLALTKNCTPTQQVLNAERAGYRAVIIHNVGSNTIYELEGENIVHIPSLFIGEANGLILRAQFLYGSGYYLVLTGDYSFTFFAFLIPAILACLGCMCIMCGWQVFRCIADRRRLRRRLLPQKILQDIPTKTFEAGSDPWDTCAICLEDYVNGDVVRKLPCRHAFHRDCVDPWLTRTKRVCPVCKRHVLTATTSMTCYDTDEEEAVIPESERRPLIRPRTSSRNYGTSGSGPSGGTGEAGSLASGEAAVAPPRNIQRSRRSRRQDPRAPASRPPDGDKAGSSPCPPQVVAEVMVHQAVPGSSRDREDSTRSSRRKRRRLDGYRRLPDEPESEDPAGHVAAAGGEAVSVNTAPATAHTSKTRAGKRGSKKQKASVTFAEDASAEQGPVQDTGEAGAGQTPAVQVVSPGEAAPAEERVSTDVV